MRVSEYYKLGRTQPTLDFVDVDIANDLKVFIDPYAIRNLESDLTDEGISLIQNYFNEVLTLARAKNDARAIEILLPLREPNETHLGLSKGKSRGRCLGKFLANKIWQKLKSSKAVTTGLVEDLEDTLLFIEKVGPDVISDIATNLMRPQLIAYTQDMCETYGIPTVDDVNSGPLWDPIKKSWHSKGVKLPVTPKGRLLLVPKAIVRTRLEFNVDEYYNHFLLEHLKQSEFSEKTELVRIIKTKKGEVKKPPFKKDVAEKFGRGKAMILEQTLKAPKMLSDYRSSKAGKRNEPLNHDELSATTHTKQLDLKKLLDAVLDIPSGPKTAHEYEKASEQLLSAMFYPDLLFPKLQTPLNARRKIIDITYSNAAQGAFFSWLAKHYPCAKIIIECKNYTDSVGNEELDQLAGRFSKSRGTVGILVCRNFDDKARFIESCRDTTRDDRGYIIPLDDDDLKALVADVIEKPLSSDFPLLRARFERLIM
jgi:hypothetical protein